MGIQSASYTVSGTRYDASGTGSAFSYTGSTESLTLPADGIYTVNFTLTDNAGYTPPTVSSTIEVETRAPSIIVTPLFDSQKWFRSGTSGRWQASVQNDIPVPGVTSSQYQIGYSPTPTANFGSLSVIASGAVTAAPIAIPSGYSNTTGYYYLQVTASNNAGLSATPVVSGPYKLDSIPPSMGSSLTTSYPGDGTVLVSWSPATDSISGLVANPYSLTYTKGTDNPISVALNASQLSANQSLTLLHGTKVTFTLTATNNAGVPNSKSVTLAVPPRLSFSSACQGETGPFMEVDLDFNLTPQQMHDSFTNLNFARSLFSSSLPSLAAGSVVTLANLSIDPTKIPLNPDGSLIPDTSAMPPWKTDQAGNIVYIDWIPVASAAGHKLWNYTLVPTPFTDPVVNATQSATLPNNPGSLSFQIEDVNGNLYSPSSTDFHVYADGRVQVVIQGTDPDQDHWDYEVDRTMQTGPLTAYKSLTGAALVGYDGSASGTPGAPVPITLRQGINNLSVFWQEGKDAGAVFHSSIESVNLEFNVTTGNYSISVTDGYSNPADSNTVGILTTPGAPLNFTLDTGTLDPSIVSQIQWNWNDNTNPDFGGSATHRYGQSAGQTSDSTAYSLNLTIPGNSTPVSLIVTVQDTQDGTLYVSEDWRGDHKVTGVVVVPPSLTLTIEPNEAVQFQGGLGAGFGQGLDIQGTLNAKDQIIFRQATGQTTGWGTILIEGSGTAQFGADLIENAERGVAVGGGATATLTGTTLTQNKIGLHLAGVSATSVTGAVITGNTVYGIKEDGGGRPVLTNSTVRSNFRNYYSWNGGLLGITEINALPGNSGNQGE